MTHRDKEVITAALNRYRDSFGGVIPNYVLKEMAEVHDVGFRTLRRWASHSPVEPSVSARPSFEMTTEHLVAIRSHLNVKNAYNELFEGISRGSKQWVSYPTFHRAWQALPASMREGILMGWDEMAKRHVYVSSRAPHRNHTWHLDHTQADIWVSLPRGQIVRPYISIVRDGATSVILAATAYQGSPNEDSIADLLATAATEHVYRLGDDVIQVGGLPVQVAFDNAREHFAAAVTRGLMTLGVVQAPTKAYYKHQNGTAETTFSGLNKQLLKGLPGYRHGGKDDVGQDLIVTSRPEMVDPAQVLTIESFQRHLDKWVVDQNRGSKMRRHGDRTPLEAWSTDPTEIRWVPEVTLRALMTREQVQRAVNKEGIRFRGVDYIAPELNAYRERGLKLNVRFLLREWRFIEVFDGEDWVCRAHDRDLLTEEQKRRIIEYREADLATLKRINADANQDRLHRAMTTEEQAYDDAVDPYATAAVDAATAHVVDIRSARALVSGDPTAPSTEAANNDDLTPDIERVDPTKPRRAKRQRAAPKKTKAQAKQEEEGMERIRQRPGSDFGGAN